MPSGEFPSGLVPAGSFPCADCCGHPAPLLRGWATSQKATSQGFGGWKRWAATSLPFSWGHAGARVPRKFLSEPQSLSGGCLTGCFVSALPVAPGKEARVAASQPGAVVTPGTCFCLYGVSTFLP